MRLQYFNMAVIHRIKYPIRYVIYALFIIFPGQGISFASDIENVLIISVDALHPNALSARTSKIIYQLMEQGVYTLEGQSTDPPLTLLAHAAMFSGLSPKESGRTDNTWKKREPTIQGETIFDIAKSEGYETGFFYSKEKLGYLINKFVDQHEFDKDFSLEKAEEFFKKSRKKRFCFLHISGLDRMGPTEGWMSPGYLEELFFIDETIASLVRWIESKKNYLIIVTSDHAGHGTTHGSDHPEDAKLPLVMASDIVDLKHYQNIKYQVTELKFILEMILTP